MTGRRADNADDGGRARRVGPPTLVQLRPRPDHADTVSVEKVACTLMRPTKPLAASIHVRGCARCGEPITVGVVTASGSVLHLDCRRLCETVTEWAEQDLHEDCPEPAPVDPSGFRSLDILTDGLGELLLVEEPLDQELRDATRTLLPMLYDALRVAGYGNCRAPAPARE